MRREIIHEGASELTYEIREIVQVGKRFESMGINIRWENIGDPIQKGEPVADWIKQIVAKKTLEDISYGYTQSQGDPEAREFLSDMVNSRGGAKVTSDDIVFFNGLGDAINKLYSLLKREARIIGPSPAYSTHSSAEAAHSGYAHLTYNLNPLMDWLPDLEDLENKVMFNDSIAGILIINPDNPTGALYPRDILEGIVRIARENDLFIICDETYCHVTFPDSNWTYLSEVIEDVPAISLRSLSKEVPWPGSRCGWIEVYNRSRDKEFNGYIDSIINAKRLEVCSTTMPQLALKEILSSSLYQGHLKSRSRMIHSRSMELWDALKDIEGIKLIKPKGGLYATVLFNSLPNQGVLKINREDVREYTESIIEGVASDKRFAYYLLAAKGICIVPLSGFYSSLKGFRITLLEYDDRVRGEIYSDLRDGIVEYLRS